MTGCGDGTVTVPQVDATPPAVRLDLLNLPPQVGSSMGSENVDVSETCCDIGRIVPLPASVDVLARGTDADGGVQWVRVDGHVLVRCSAASPEDWREFDVIIARNADTAATPIEPRTAPSERFAIGSFHLADWWRPCRGAPATHISIEVTAWAGNYNGLPSRPTKSITLTHPT